MRNYSAIGSYERAGKYFSFCFYFFPLSSIFKDIAFILGVEIRRKIDLINPLLFFMMVVTLFPLGVTPDLEKLSMLAPGIIWVAALLSTLLSLDMMFRNDYDDGSLEQILLSAKSVEGLVLAKIIAHWMVTGLPLTLMSPMLGMMLSLPQRAMIALMASLAVSIIQTFNESPPKTRWLRDANIPMPTPRAKPIPAPSVIPISACCPIS